MKSQTILDFKNERQTQLNKSLTDAVNHNNLKLAKKLLQAGADSSTGIILAAACCKNYDDMVWLLLVNGSNPNVEPDTNGNTPLHLATVNGNKKIIDLLLHFGAKPDVLNKIAASPLSIARQKYNKSILEVFLNFFNRTPLQRHKDMVIAFLKKERSHWFIGITEDTKIEHFIDHCEGASSATSLLESVIQTIKATSSSCEYFISALNHSYYYLSRIVELEKEAQQSVVALPPTTNPSAPPSSYAEVEGEEPKSTDDEPGLEGQQKSSPLVALSILAPKPSDNPTTVTNKLEPIPNHLLPF